MHCEGFLQGVMTTGKDTHFELRVEDKDDEGLQELTFGHANPRVANPILGYASLCGDEDGF